MPRSLDIHKAAPTGLTPEQVKAVHDQDIAIQDRYGVKYLKYWYDKDQGTVFCLIDASSKEAAEPVLRASRRRDPRGEGRGGRT